LIHFEFWIFKLKLHIHGGKRVERYLIFHGDKKVHGQKETVFQLAADSAVLRRSAQRSIYLSIHGSDTIYGSDLWWEQLTVHGVKVNSRLRAPAWILLSIIHGLILQCCAQAGGQLGNTPWINTASTVVAKSEDNPGTPLPICLWWLEYVDDEKSALAV
jgi:hypothetical protein